MCGIGGVFEQNKAPIDQALLESMQKAMVHRGPDDHGIYVDEFVGLVHRRLSIIDLSRDGHQPMFTSDGRFCIVYNGEIYNHEVLRSTLRNLGYQFKSRTDTETILYGFQEFGFDVVHRLNGMFAFAIWDRRDKKLHLFRDRLGIKPLYYHVNSERLIFASEIKPILAYGAKAAINWSALSDYLSLRYVPGDSSLFNNIQKLEPGSIMTCTPSCIGKPIRYWDLSQINQATELSKTNATEHFLSLFEESVTKRLMGDVPVGAFLSAGIDSSAVTALMKQSTEKVNTFTLGFGLQNDEIQEAKRNAKLIGVNNDSIYISGNDYEHFSEVITHLEEPLGHPIILPTYLLAKKASEKVKVVLLGDGADEVLGGYIHHLVMLFSDKLSSIIPNVAISHIAGLLKLIPHNMLEPFFPYPAVMGKSGLNRLYKYANNITNPSQAYLSLASAFDHEDQKKLFKDDFYNQYVSNHGIGNRFSDYLDSCNDSDLQNKILKLDLRYWNADFTLMRMDKLTMAHSIEGRFPFLDHHLVEFLLSLPPSLKTKGFKQKIILRNALSKHGGVPAHIIKKKKRAFYLPVDECFDSSFWEFVRDNLSDDSIRRRGLFEVEYVRKLLDRKSQDISLLVQVMTLLFFELWAQKFIDN